MKAFSISAVLIWLTTLINPFVSGVKSCNRLFRKLSYTRANTSVSIYERRNAHICFRAALATQSAPVIAPKVSMNRAQGDVPASRGLYQRGKEQYQRQPSRDASPSNESPNRELCWRLLEMLMRILYGTISFHFYFYYSLFISNTRMLNIMSNICNILLKMVECSFQDGRVYKVIIIYR